MNELDVNIAKSLLKINAIKLNPENHFTWASGWYSPIYCDNRKVLSFPEAREQVKKAFGQRVKELYPDVEVIAGVATGAIAHGVLVAEELDLPFVYVRSAAKKHGLENLVEGEIKEGQKVVVIEDLVSTGGSSLKAVDALKERGCEVMGMLAIFSYGFNVSVENFEKAGVKLDTLTDYNVLIEQAVEMSYVKSADIETLQEWRKNPADWKK